ncbi:MAG: SAM-dependent chlorinase/fluorinase [Anaerolineae bacterium]|nr:SAM-dependent chlorinase/fluorinase [Anaerolineae bacterium]
MSIVTLLTDFGWKDGYVGIMKGVILGIAPHVTLVDITHDIAPQDVRDAAYVLYTAVPYFPPDTVHLVVVDPGVGSERRAIAVRTAQGAFVAPDNGVLSYVLVANPPQIAVSLTNPRYRLPQVSHTFHGRDIFAPAAAHLAQGVPLTELGEPVQELITFPLPQAQIRPDGSVSGQVIHVDHFGNAITNLRREDIPWPDERLLIEVGGRVLAGLHKTYAQGQPGEPLALIGSSGHLEIAVPGGNAAQSLNVCIGSEVRLRRR